MEHSLAIIVPAWKHDFLYDALSSIRRQTCQRFQCYIFDDAGPKEIKTIAAFFPEFSYFRYNENMGKKNLVAHWNRCLQDIEENWVWFFSDDDLMDSLCVEKFYETKAAFPNANVFRFELDLIDQSNTKIMWSSHSTPNESAISFLRKRLLGLTHSCLPDHIFNKNKLVAEIGGFVDFPLAWNSDDATWCYLSKENFIVAITSARVKWRQSTQNITSQTDNSNEKFLADQLYYLWCTKHLILSTKDKILFFQWFSRRVRLRYKFHIFYIFKINVLQRPLIFFSMIHGICLGYASTTKKLFYEHSYHI